MNPAASQLKRRLQERLLKPDGLSDLFAYVSQSLGYALTIYDTNGFTFRDPRLREAFEPYAMHTHPFCSIVKKTPRNNRRCTANRKYAVKKALREKRSFYGKCYMGVEEIVFPVVYRDMTIAVVFLGQFGSRHSGGMGQLAAKADRYGVDAELLRHVYEQIARTMDESQVEDLLRILSAISHMIVLSYQDFILTARTNPALAPPQPGNTLSREQDIARAAYEYVQHAYYEPFHLANVARHCNCSASYLSRCFSQAFGMPLVKYVNQVRLQHAKSLLGTTTLPVMEIAMSLGFNDTNYFSKVFKASEGVSPVAYRKRRASPEV